MVTIWRHAVEDRRRHHDSAVGPAVRHHGRLLGARGQLLGAAGGRSTRSSRRWPRTTTSGRWRCARRAASCSIATASVLVENRRSYSISIVREHTKDLNRTVRLLAAVLGHRRSGVREIVDRHRREPIVPADHDRAGRDARAGRRGHRAPARLRAAGRRRRAGADAAVSGDDGGAPVRLRRRGQRRAGRPKTTSLKSGDIVGQSGIEKVYNAHADGRGRRQARRRQQRRPRNPDARRRASRPKASGCS